MKRLRVAHPDQNMALERVLLFESRVIDLHSAAFVSHGCLDKINESFGGYEAGAASGSDLDSAAVKMHRSGEAGLMCSVQVFATNAIEDDTDILLPPLALQKMAIYRHRLRDDEDVYVDLVDKSSSKLISDLSLSSLRGVQCDPELEKNAMQYFFSRPRFFNKGDVLCVPLLPSQPSSQIPAEGPQSEEETVSKDANPRLSTEDPLFDYGGVVEMSFVWYVATSIGYNEGQWGRTSPDTTKVSVASNAARPSLMPDITFVSKLAFTEVTMASMSKTDASGCGLLPHGGHENVLVRDAARQTVGRFRAGAFLGVGFMSRNINSHGNGNSDYSEEHLMQVLRALAPALEVTQLLSAYSSVSSAGKGALRTAPVLVQCPRLAHSRRQMLLECAGALGLHLYALDARFLWEYRQGGKFARNVGFPHQSSGTLNDVLLTQAHTSSVVDVAKLSPCLLYVEGVEDLLDDIKGLRLGDEPAADAFAENLKQFLTDLLELQTTHTIVPLVTVDSIDSLTRRTKLLFFREVFLSVPLTSSSSVNDADAHAQESQEVREHVAAFLGMSKDCVNVPTVKKVRGTSGVKGDASDSIGAGVAPVRWADIGGLSDVRQEILNIIQLPLLRPELFPPGVPRRRAALLYGAPGTGKTLIAKAVATECGMNFVSVKGPELLDMYVGESERNVRLVFQNARKNAPCVLFFDELDSLAPARGRGGDGGGVMDRVVAQLLVEMDSLSSSGSHGSSGTIDSSRKAGESPSLEETRANLGVFVLGATNRPDLLDPALLRPGRFDRKIYLSVCKDAATRENILRAQTRKLNLHRDLDLSEVAAILPDNLTGADLSAAVSEAFTRAQSAKIDSLRRAILAEIKQVGGVGANEDEGDDWDEGDDSDPIVAEVAARINRLPNAQLRVVVTREDLLGAVHALTPSVSREELRHYEKLAQQYSDL